MRYYYIPLCSKDFTFENIFASESISPPIFYKERGFGIDYFYTVLNKIETALILFGELPSYTIPFKNDDVQKFILAIQEDSLDLNDLVFLKEGIFSYPKTVYLNRRNSKILFFSEKEKRLITLKSETSLPTKSFYKYEEEFEIISESMCKNFDLTDIEFSKIPSVDLSEQISKDRKFNNFKGFIYGLTTSLLNLSSGSHIKLKSELQSFTDAFAEFKNRLENDSKISSRTYTKNISVESYFQKALTIVENLNSEFAKAFPPAGFSDNLLADFLLEKQGDFLRNIIEAQQYINFTKLNDKILGTTSFEKLKYLYYLNNVDKNPLFYFDLIKNKLDFYYSSHKSNSVSSKKNKEESNEIIKDALYSLEKIIEVQHLDNSKNSVISLAGIELDILTNEITLTNQFSFLEKPLIIEFSQILNVLFTRSKIGKGEINNAQLLEIVADVENKYSKSKKNKPSSLYQYLNNEIDTYSIDKVSSIVMQNFIAFIFNPNSIEKLRGFLNAKKINHSWIAYSFWCTFNGFANISGDFVNPIFKSQNKKIQDYLDDFLFEVLYAFLNNSIKETGAHINKKETPSSQIGEKGLKDLHSKINKKYNIPLEDFEQIFKQEDRDLFYKILKDKYKIVKKEAKNIYDSFLEFKKPSLF